jgi:hypothetical protein
MTPGKAPPAEKSAYQTPKLVVYGSLAKLTQNGNGSGDDGGAIGGMMMGGMMM